MPRDDVLSTGPAAAYLGIGEQTLRDWVLGGRIPFIRLPSGRYRFRVVDLDEMLAVKEATDAKAAS